VEPWPISSCSAAITLCGVARGGWCVVRGAWSEVRGKDHFLPRRGNALRRR
jgi:hypothetical protein